jgi:fructose-bisphosphate aldolase class II
MALATPAQFGDMIDAARKGGFAYPAVNVSSSQTLNAALRGFAEANSDGIVQVTTGGAAYAAGAHGEMALGARAIAEYARIVAEGWPVRVALHSDHCPPSALDAFVRPLLADARARRSRGEEPLFAGHMFDGSALPLDENLDIAEPLLAECAALGVVLEVECGVVGGEEDGVRGEPGKRLYTTSDDLMRVVDRLGAGERGRYLLAATFGNVHGVYAPEHARLLAPDPGDDQGHLFLGLRLQRGGAAAGRPRIPQPAGRGGGDGAVERLRRHELAAPAPLSPGVAPRQRERLPAAFRAAR